jgi:peptidoglycan/xylan/chitin deacetylase (PgdA/CDA1 family)
MSVGPSAAAGVGDRLVLCYHAVSDVVASTRTVRRSELRRHVAALVDRGYVGMTFNRVVLERTRKDRLAVTFDDGDRSVLEHAFSVLSELGVPGTAFVAAGTVGAPGLLGWDELRLLANAGWEIGSHSVTHACLTDVDDAALEEELRASRELIEAQLGVPCRSIAYPYGESDERVRAAARRTGYTAGCTTGGTRRADVLDWPRVGIDGRDGPIVTRLKTSRLGRSLRGTPLRASLDRAGRTVRRVHPR